MTDSLHEFLVQHSVGLMFLVIGFGYLIGQVKVCGFELGSVSGVLFVGLTCPLQTRPDSELGLTGFWKGFRRECSERFFNIFNLSC